MAIDGLIDRLRNKLIVGTTIKFNIIIRMQFNFKMPHVQRKIISFLELNSKRDHHRYIGSAINHFEDASKLIMTANKTENQKKNCTALEPSSVK